MSELCVNHLLLVSEPDQLSQSALHPFGVDKLVVSWNWMCATVYGVPWRSFSMSTVAHTKGVTQGHWQHNHSIEHM